MGRWSPDDDLYMHAVVVVIRSPRTSTAAPKRGLCGDGELVDDNCCAWLLTRTEYDGIVGRVDSENCREVLFRFQYG
jgi:hypothetical protein